MQQKILADGYRALTEALATVTWFKDEFKTLVNALLRDHPEILASLDFGQTKRNVSKELTSLLVRHEKRYQDLTLSLMMELSSKTQFPDIQRTPEPQRSELLAKARESVAQLKELVDAHKAMLDEQGKVRDQIQTYRFKLAEAQSHASALAELKDRFLSLQSGNMKPQERGRALEPFLYDLFALFDLEPRVAYKLESEQIDGSFRLDTDDYILEAKWTQDRAGRPEADLFAAKVRTKGKNAVGLFLSINGFTEDFISRFREGTPFLTMDGTDLYLILEGRIRLTDVLLSKKRWANDTGSCHFPVSQMQV